MKRTEEHKMIAEFMGKEVELIDGVYKEVGKDIHPQPLYYHDSWSWLMEVVERIDKTPTVTSTEEEKYYYCVSLMGSQVEVLDPKANTLIINIKIDETDWKKSTYEAVVAFITWYNL